MDIEFDENAHSFVVEEPFWRTTIAFGDKHAFIVNSDLNDDQVKTLEQTIRDKGSLFGNIITSGVITFDATCVALIPQKQMPVPSVDNLGRAFDFGLIQGVKQSDLHLEYWGKSAVDGRTIVHTTLSNRFEVDTTEAVKPFTRVSGRRFSATLVPSKKKGFHAFKVNSRGFDHPQFSADRFRFFRGPRDLLPRQFLLRSVSCQLDLVTIFSLFDKAASKFDSISATHWRVKWAHTVSYKEKVDSEGKSDFRASVTGPERSDLMPHGGSPSDVDQVARDVIAMAQAGTPLMTPEVLNSRLTAGAGITTTNEDTNPDFDSSFITADH